MKRIAIVLLITLLAGMIVSCSAENAASPDIAQIRSICDLATLECYYHNVAKSTKDKSSGLAGFGEVEREFWIEYEGVVKIGIDMSQVIMDVQNTTVTVTLPEAKVLEIGIANDSWNESSYIHSGDSWFNKNKITAEDQKNAIADAQTKMKETAEGNTQLLEQARSRAQKLIENYIKKLGDLSGVEYEIKWIYANTNIQ